MHVAYRVDTYQKGNDRDHQEHHDGNWVKIGADMGREVGGEVKPLVVKGDDGFVRICFRMLQDGSEISPCHSKGGKHGQEGQSQCDKGGSPTIFPADHKPEDKKRDQGQQWRQVAMGYEKVIHGVHQVAGCPDVSSYDTWQ